MHICKQFVKRGLLAALVAGSFMACQQSGKTANTAANTPAAGNTSTPANGGGNKIAYVDLDSLEAHFDYFKEKKDELEKKQQVIENELKGNARALQNEYADLQRKAATLTQEQGEAAQRSIMQKNQQLEAKAQQMRSQYAEQEAKFNEELQKRLDGFLKTYNAEGKYDYILSYRAGATNILFKNPALDVTADVIKGMNAIGTDKK